MPSGGVLSKLTCRKMFSGICGSFLIPRARKTSFEEDVMSNQIRHTLAIQVNDRIFLPVLFAILGMALLFPLSSLSQVIIKEKFSIDSLSTKQGHVSKDGGSRGNGAVFSSSSVFVQCSGNLTFRSSWPVTGGFGDCATITMNVDTIFQGSLNQARD